MIYSALGGGMLLLGLALTFMTNAYLDKRDEVVQLSFAAQIMELTQKHKEDKEAAVKAIAFSYDTRIDTLTTENRETVNAITKEMLSAKQDALQKPLAFGDNLIRDYILADCLLSLGSNNNLQRRTACSTEAKIADTASTGLYFSTITPTFLRNWGEACEDWRDIGTAAAAVGYTIVDWRERWGNFREGMCSEVLVSMTPETSKFFSRFAAKAVGHALELTNYAVEQNEIIDILTKRTQKEAPDK